MKYYCANNNNNNNKITSKQIVLTYFPFQATSEMGSFWTGFIRKRNTFVRYIKAKRNFIRFETFN